MKSALFPGTFDPPTLGHLDIIERAAKICDHLVIGVGANLSKKEKKLFTPEEKIEMLKIITNHLSHIEIVSFSGLVVDFAKEKKIHFLIRGLRAFSDFEYEFSMALANRKISGIETVFLMADARHAHISSSLIRELGGYHSHLHEFIPSSIEDKVYKRFRSDS